MKATGWLLDVYVSGKNAVLWFKLTNGQALRLADRYEPDFYVTSKENTNIIELARVLRQHPTISCVVDERRFTSLNSREKSEVLRVYVDCAKNLRRVLGDVEKLGLIKAYYNLAIPHAQRYLFHRDLAPTHKVAVEYDSTSRLLSLHTLEDPLEIEPPPFTALIFDVEIKRSGGPPAVDNAPISRVTLFSEDLSMQKTFGGREEETLSRFAEFLKQRDPDFLVSRQGETGLRHVLERARALRLNLQLGRENVNIFKLGRLLPPAHRGRVYLDLRTFLRLGIGGVVTRSRFTLAPPGLSAKWPAGRTIDSRQCYEALKKDIVLPASRGNFRYVTTAKDTLFRDKGGLILSPQIGLHENVAELDYESMYPQIIINHNISYETVTPCFVDESKRGFLGELTKASLEKRLYFKHLRKRYDAGSREWLWCEQRQLVLKEILVCIYGYSGCFANRFNNVKAYEEINRVARDILVETVNLSLHKGFEVIYADSDSIFVKQKDADQKDYEILAELIHRKTGLPIALDYHYKFLVFLTQESNPNLGATRRYFGKRTNGKPHYRGIELRRHDCPVFLRQFQENLIEILFDAERAELVEKTQLQKACDYVAETCDKVSKGKIEPESLIVSKVLRKPVTKYRGMLPHVVAAIQLTQKGKRPRTGETIDFLYVNASHRNPFRRVVPATFLRDGPCPYDRVKYRELVLDVAETVLNVFGFNKELWASSQDLKIESKKVNRN